MPPRHPHIAQALGLVRQALASLPTEPPIRVHVACSGGPDSVAMLGLLHLIADRDRLILSVGHIDHGLRATSQQDAAMVSQHARTLGLACEIQRLNLAKGPGVPAAARDARRAALRAQAGRHHARFIALGHTATDQAETVLMHLCRGAALEGLAAMASFDPFDDEAPGGWLRPLLAFGRPQTRTLAEQLGLTFVDDPTNEDQRHPRVRMRHAVLPMLRAFNPRVEQAIARMAGHARDADDALGAWVERELRSRRRPPSDRADPGDDRDAGRSHMQASGGQAWSIVGMGALPRAIRTRFVRRICRDAGSPEDALAARTLESIDRALRGSDSGRSWDLHPQLRLRMRANLLWIESATTHRRPDQQLTPPKGEAMLPAAGKRV